MAISLIGYRGCGKSTVAPVLAASLGWAWADADAELEARAGRSIREIFAAEGEPFFRDLESDVLADLASRRNVVLAAGGGAVLREANRAALRAGGPVVWLEAPLDVLLRRIEGDASTASRRPALTPTGGREEVERLLAIREPLYREAASIVVSSAGRSPQEIAEEIAARLPRL